MTLLLALVPALYASDPLNVAPPAAPPSSSAMDVRQALESALASELVRAQQLTLPDMPRPYAVAFDVLDGDVATTYAEFGAPVVDTHAPYRSLRAEVRVGDYALDSSSFSGLGIPDGVVSRVLPAGGPSDADTVAFRREAWLAADAAYKNAVQTLSRKQAALNGSSGPRPADWTPAPAVDLPLSRLPAASPADAARVHGLAVSLSKVLGEFPGLEVGQVVARDWQGARLELTSAGTRAWLPTGYTVLRAEGTVRLPDGAELTDSRSWVVRRPSDLPSDADLTAEVRSMASWLQGLPTAAKEDDYLGPVLFEAPAAVELMSQLLAPELVGTPPEVQDGDAVAAGGNPPPARLGRRLLPLGWTVADDVPAAPEPVRYALDQEGVAPRRVELVRDGVLLEMLMSRIPNRDRAASTGHGRSLGDSRRGAMPGNVVITPARAISRHRLERQALRLAAAAGRDYVLVIGRLQPPALTDSIDIAITGEGQLAGLTAPYEAWRLYADGHTEPVRGLTFNGVDRRVLRDIAAAGASDAVTMLDGPPGTERYTIGATGGIPVRWQAPAVLITEMELLGARGGEPRALKVR